MHTDKSRLQQSDRIRERCVVYTIRDDEGKYTHQPILKINSTKFRKLSSTISLIEWPPHTPHAEPDPRTRNATTRRVYIEKISDICAARVTLLTAKNTYKILIQKIQKSSHNISDDKR